MIGVQQQQSLKLLCSIIKRKVVKQTVLRTAIAMNSADQNPGISKKHLKVWQERFDQDSQKLIAQKGCTSFDTSGFLAKRNNVVSHVFNTKVSKEVKPVSNQKSSGRCWIYACLNAMRIPFCKKYNLEEMEFSQTHIFFWDKVERCNYMLSSYLELAKRGEESNSRLTQHLLTMPSNDGGQWQMLVNLIEKYGILPNAFWPSPYLAENSRRLGLILNAKLREYCCKLKTLVTEGASEEKLDTEKNDMMATLYNVITTCLGSPPGPFEFEFYDKDKKYQKIGPITSLDFYQQHIKPLYDVSDKICLTNDSRSMNPYNKLYTVEYLNNMTNAGDVLYINLPIDTLKDYARRSIEISDEPVWFGSDVGKEFYRKPSILSTDQFDYQMVLGITMRGLTKGQRLEYKESEMTHAMLLTAVQLEEQDDKKVSTKWRVENSWGEDGDGKGYLVMTDDWFTEYVYEVVIDKKLLSSDILSILDQTPTALPAWDPMGALA